MPDQGVLEAADDSREELVGVLLFEVDESFLDLGHEGEEVDHVDALRVRIDFLVTEWVLLITLRSSVIRS